MASKQDGDRRSVGFVAPMSYVTRSHDHTKTHSAEHTNQHDDFNFENAKSTKVRQAANVAASLCSQAASSLTWMPTQASAKQE